jgi:hypothetical protein
MIANSGAKARAVRRGASPALTLLLARFLKTRVTSRRSRITVHSKASGYPHCPRHKLRPVLTVPPRQHSDGLHQSLGHLVAVIRPDAHNGSSRLPALLACNAALSGPAKTLLSRVPSRSGNRLHDERDAYTESNNATLRGSPIRSVPMRFMV